MLEGHLQQRAAHLRADQGLRAALAGLDIGTQGGQVAVGQRGWWAA